jgi:hypothetical protein
MQLLPDNRIDKIMYNDVFNFTKIFRNIRDISVMLISDKTKYDHLLSYYYATLNENKIGVILSSYDVSNMNNNYKFDIKTFALINGLYKTSITYSLNNTDHNIGEIVMCRAHFMESINDHYKLCNIMQHLT